MRKLFAFVAMVLIAAAETAALACTCIALPTDATERRRLARDVADGAIALVEAELERAYDAASGTGERLRVVSTLAGQAPASVEIERSGAPDGARCDVEFRRGERVIVMLYPPHTVGSGEARFRLADKCLTQLVGDSTFRAELVAAMSAREERGAGA